MLLDRCEDIGTSFFIILYARIVWSFERVLTKKENRLFCYLLAFFLLRSRHTLITFNTFSAFE